MALPVLTAGAGGALGSYSAESLHVVRWVASEALFNPLDWWETWVFGDLPTIFLGGYLLAILWGRRKGLSWKDSHALAGGRAVLPKSLMADLWDKDRLGQFLADDRPTSP